MVKAADGAAGLIAAEAVRQLAGSRPRVHSVLTYGEHPDMKLNELTRNCSMAVARDRSLAGAG
jgi:hypothetical protein